MSTLSLRLPKSLHDLAREVAQEEEISINQWITLALAEKLSALKTEEFFERVLAKVSKQAPAKADRWPARRKP